MILFCTGHDIYYKNALVIAVADTRQVSVTLCTGAFALLIAVT